MLLRFRTQSIDSNQISSNENDNKIKTMLLDYQNRID